MEEFPPAVTETLFPVRSRSVLSSLICNTLEELVRFPWMVPTVMGVEKSSRDVRHSNWRGPVVLRPTPKFSDGFRIMKPGVAVMLNSKYWVAFLVPPIPPRFVDPLPHPVARKLLVLLVLVTPFFVKALTVKFAITAPL